jgi:DNA-binding transcriptional ArsR family regulator
MRDSPGVAVPIEDAPVFAALGDETRLRLVSRLSAGGPASIAKLTAGFSITRQAITKHLRVMEEAGLVRSAPRGRELLWALQQERLATARRYLETISARWDETLDRLKVFVERDADAATIAASTAPRAPQRPAMRRRRSVRSR